MKYNYKPSLGELRSSLKQRLREYLLENTLHGVPYFVDPTRPKSERLIWFLLTIASIVATAVTIAIIWDKFQTEPTITGLAIMTEHINIEFPQIFLCFDWTQLNHTKLNENEMYMHEQLYNWTWGKNMDLQMFKTGYENKRNFRSTFKTMIPDCNDLIINCSYKGIDKPCNKLFTKVLASVGACCKSNAMEPFGIKDTAWNLEFGTISSYFPWRLYITHNVDSGPGPGERPVVKAYFPVDIEFIVDMTYTTSDIRYLTLRQRKCYYKQEGVSLSNCETRYLIDKLLSDCNCLPWFLSFTKKTECPLSKYSCLNESNIDMNDCNCWLHCDHISYSVKGVVKSSNNVNRIILKNWPTAIYKREMRFGYLDLLVSFGGIASLFLGYSLLTSVELAYYFGLRSYCGAVIQSSRQRHNIITVHVVEKISSKTGINQKYYQYTD
ncbi:PREDICTED: pickpocket protein 28-like [Dufourea novaeangliae]|uniref:Sodium channel protein Nach n=1 Tax=Dufourea novaeangliae TaxID=178035 RepID=A0A154NY85_DUFNO|nr:PREDICTED: pickpocket protein 28-like [Dufourea novaeangliae]KZC04522.1 Sodium channel protein Nach [Dufourea novaeangliae]